ASVTPIQGSKESLWDPKPTIGGEKATGTRNNEYDKVKLNTDLPIKFTDKYVYDYYVEALDPTQADKFGFIPYKANGTFKVTNVDPDEEKFRLIIHKLLYNGYIYPDTVTIKPVP
ncbi:MAG: hypothetical protein LBL58_01640, partial [Tannerellaceae bacterium]|nr:hypothetical protein [Tannerellaceae bacterium]